MDLLDHLVDVVRRGVRRHEAIRDTSCALKHGLCRAADQDRHVLVGNGVNRQVREIVVLALVLEELTTERLLDDFDRFSTARTTGLPIGAADLEIFGPRAQANAE